MNAEIYHSQRATWLNENILTYQTNIKRKHFFNSMVGVTLQNSDYEYYSYKTVQIPNEALGMAGMSEGTPSTTKSLKSSWSMLSFLEMCIRDSFAAYENMDSWIAESTRFFNQYVVW